MLAILRAKKSAETKQNCFFCISLRQWAILFSILIFIITAIITTCTVLGTLHTKKLLQLLQNDIEIEHEKRFEYYDTPAINRNEALLHHSQDIVLSLSKVISICMWLSWLNLVLAAILIYGVTTMTPIYIFPWIILSGVTYLVAIIAVIMGYLNLIPGLSYSVLFICVVASIFFMEMWYTIVLYYLTLKRTRCLRYSSYTPTVVQAYGGYTHTIKPFKDSDGKPLV